MRCLIYILLICSEIASASCGANLLRAAGKTGSVLHELPALYLKHSRLKDQESMEYIMSIMFVESSFDRHAHQRDAKAYGLMQITRMAVEDANQECNLQDLESMTDLYDSATTVRYGSCFIKRLQRSLKSMNLYSEDTKKNWRYILILYNGGYTQLNKYLEGDKMSQETEDYYRKVEAVKDSICLSGK